MIIKLVVPGFFEMMFPKIWPKRSLFLFIVVLFSIGTMTNIVQLIINGKSIDGAWGIRTRDRRMDCLDESTELIILTQK